LINIDKSKETMVWNRDEESSSDNM